MYTCWFVLGFEASQKFKNYTSMQVKNLCLWRWYVVRWWYYIYILSRSDSYRTKDLLCLTIMVMSASTDKRLTCCVLQHDFTICLGGLLDAVDDSHWRDDFLLPLCYILPQLSTHHHNLTQMVAILPPTPRGHQFQRAFSYTLLHSLCLDMQPSDGDIVEPRVAHLFPLVQSLQVNQPQCDFYLLHNQVQLLDYCVGQETLPVKEKVDTY